MPYNFSPEKIYREKQSAIAKENWKLGIYDSRVLSLETRQCKNEDCSKSFNVKPYDPKIFCSHNCSAHVSNHKRQKTTNNYFCLYCKKILKTGNYKYCSNKCQKDHIHQSFIKSWKSGEENGISGIITKSLSIHIRRKFATHLSKLSFIKPQL